MFLLVVFVCTIWKSIPIDAKYFLKTTSFYGQSGKGTGVRKLNASDVHLGKMMNIMYVNLHLGFDTYIFM